MGARGGKARAPVPSGTSRYKLHRFGGVEPSRLLVSFPDYHRFHRFSSRAACLFDDAQIAARQFANPPVLTASDCVWMDEVPADAESDSARTNKIPGRILIDTTGSNQSHSF